MRLENLAKIRDFDTHFVAAFNLAKAFGFKKKIYYYFKGDITQGQLKQIHAKGNKVFTYLKISGGFVVPASYYKQPSFTYSGLQNFVQEVDKITCGLIESDENGYYLRRTDEFESPEWIESNIQLYSFSLSKLISEKKRERRRARKAYYLNRALEDILYEVEPQWRFYFENCDEWDTIPGWRMRA